MSVKKILNSVLLSLQLCLGFWQIGKLTPIGALVQCGIGWLFSRCRLPLGLSADYSRLEGIEGHAKLYKWVRCHVTVPPDQPTVPREAQLDEREKRSCYLGVEFHLERRGENMLYIDDKMCYYITDTIWYNLLDFAEAAAGTVVVKGYKEFWQAVVTGGVMRLPEVLDNIILENHTIKALDNHLLLPVNLSISEEKILKALNLAGLFLQTKHVYWVIPTCLSFAAALLEFCPSLRIRLYGQINLFFCRFMHVICDRLHRSVRRQVYSLGSWVENLFFCRFIHVICDRLHRSVRRQVYSLGSWVENLKPSNDLKLRVVRGDTCAVIGGGAKLGKEGATLFEADVFDWAELDGEEEFVTKIICGVIDPDYPPFDIACKFNTTTGKCSLDASSVALADVSCRDRMEFEKLYIFLSCVAKNRSGSLKSCGSNNKVRVRGFAETVACYSRNGFPPVYELKLDNVVVE